MKDFGSILEFTQERNADLLRAYKEECAKVKYIRLSEICERIVNSPSKRFWVSELRAMIVCSQIMRGIPVLETMRRSKREMFEEIYRRVVALKEQHPDWPMIELTTAVVFSPAPKFYMEPRSAMELIFKMRNGWYDRKSNK